MLRDSKPACATDVARPRLTPRCSTSCKYTCNNPCKEIDDIAAKIPALGGETFLLELPKLQPEDETRIIEAFRAPR